MHAEIRGRLIITLNLVLIYSYVWTAEGEITELFFDNKTRINPSSCVKVMPFLNWCVIIHCTINSLILNRYLQIAVLRNRKKKLLGYEIYQKD